MMKNAIVRRYLLLVVFASTWLFCQCWADSQEGGTDSPSGPQNILDLDAKLAELAKERQILVDAQYQLRLRMSDADREYKSIESEIEAIERLEAKVQQLAEELEKAKRDAEMRAKELEDAARALEEAKARADKAQAEVAKATELVTNTEKDIESNQQQLAAALPKLEPRKTQLQNAKSVRDALQNEISSLDTNLLQFQRDEQNIINAIESALRQQGDWISFKDQIAPIFYDRCVACHNAIISKGQYDMSTFAGVCSDGESGLAVYPGDAEGSPLYQFIVDGWMPYESDRLSDEEISLIRAWINLGARLDSAVSKQTPLIQIMPRPRYPQPPSVYDAPVPVTSIALNADTHWIASAGYHEVLLWDAEEQLSKRVSGFGQRINGLAFSPNGKLLAVASGTPGKVGELHLVGLENWEANARLCIAEDEMFCVAFSRSGDRLAACGSDGSIYIYEVSNPVQPLHTIDAHSDWVTSVAWSSDDSKIISTSRDRTAKVFDVNSHKLLQTFAKHEKPVTAAKFSSDGQTAVSAGLDNRIRVWNLSDGEQRKEIAGFGGELTSIEHLSGDVLLSTCADGKLREHNVSNGELVREINLRHAWPCSLTMPGKSPNLYIGHQDGTIVRLNAESLELQKEWQAIPDRTSTDGAE